MLDETRGVRSILPNLWPAGLREEQEGWELYTVEEQYHVDKDAG